MSQAVVVTLAVGALAFAGLAVGIALALVASERKRADLRVTTEQASSRGVKVAAELDGARQDAATAAARAADNDARHERVIAFLKAEIADLEEGKDAGRDRGSVAARLRGMLVKVEDAAGAALAAPAAARGAVLLGSAAGGGATAGSAGGGGSGRP